MRLSRSMSLLLLGASLVACVDDPVSSPGREARGKQPSFSHASLAPPPPSLVDITVNNYSVRLSPAKFFPEAQRTPAGFFKNVGVLFGGGLAYGNSSQSVFLGYHTLFPESDLETRLPIDVLTPGPYADHQTVSLAVEAPAILLGDRTPLGLVVVRETFAYRDPPNDDFIIVKYTVFNPGGDAVSGLHIGEVFDLDVADAVDDIVQFNSRNSLVLVDDAPGSRNKIVAGHALLSEPATSYRPWGGFPRSDPSTSAGWFAFLSAGIVHPEPFGPSDIRHLLSIGPVTIPPGAARVFASVLAGGDNPTDLARNIGAARSKYASLPPSARDPYPILTVRVRIVPDPLNPASGDFKATLTFASAAQASLFDAANAFCDRALPIRTSAAGNTITLTLHRSDLNPLLRDGDKVFCAGKLADRSFFAGGDTPSFNRTLAPVTQLTFDLAADRSPTWSPDGRSIAFASDRGGSNAIWRMDVATGEASAVQLFSPVRPVGLDWSPDGSTIAFTRGVGIFTIPAVGGLASQLTATSFDTDRDPRWSPDGSEITFRRNGVSITPGGEHIWKMTAQGELTGAPAVAVAVGPGSDADPYWANDALIYFASSGRLDDPASSIFRVDPAVGEPATRVTPIEPTQNRQPAVSPDGRTLAFVSGGIILQDLSTAKHTIVLLDPIVLVSDLENLEFSPDGTRLLFSNGNDIYVADISQLR